MVDAKRSNSDQRGGVHTRRWKSSFMIVLFGLPVLAILIYFSVFMNSQPLTPKEMLAKKTWTDEELADAMARSMTPGFNADRKRNDVSKHLNDKLKALPPDRQQAVRVSIIKKSVANALEQYRALPESDRNKIIDSMTKHAEERYAYLQNMTSAERDKLRAEMEANSSKAAEAHVFTEEVTRTVMVDMNPDERKAFAPVTRIMFKTLSELK